MIRLAIATIALSAPLVAGDKLPKGPPWHTEYRFAKREALRKGQPVFVYFTKTY